MILVMLMILKGIESLEAAKVGRIKDKNDFAISRDRNVTSILGDANKKSASKFLILGSKKFQGINTAQK